MNNSAATPNPHTTLPRGTAIVMALTTLGVQLWLGNLQCMGGDGIGCMVLIIPYTAAYVLPAFSYGILSRYTLNSRYKHAAIHQTFFILLMMLIQQPSFEELYAYILWGYASLMFLVVFNTLSQAVVKLYTYARYRIAIKK